jgi:hypothetical protein
MKRIMQIATMALVALMVTATVGAATETRSAPKQVQIVKRIAAVPGARPPADKDLAAYLFVYFKDETHSIHFATSTDGRAFTDINGAQPVLAGKDIAQQKGVRDPHIMRGPDGAFYLSMTDLHIFGQKEGLRATQWERPEQQFGWGNNRSLIFMKSYDLIHWTHVLVHVGELFPAFADLGAAWAPQTIFDKEQNKLMVYFTIRSKGGHNYMVYSYADQAFTTLVTEPKRLFTYPDASKSTIDGDITKVGDKYHLYYVAHDEPGGLRHAVSDKINEGYRFDPAKVDPENVACEAPMLWRRLGSNEHVLMYDVFGTKPNNMGFSVTTDFVNYKNVGRFNEPHSPMKATNFSGPKHGAVMHITSAELQRLKGYFGTR